MGDQVESLLADLDEAIGVLAGVGEKFWQEWLRRGRVEIARGDAHGLDRLLSAFGGMGSFNDLVLSQPGSTHGRQALRHADERLQELRGSIFRRSTDLKHDLI